MTFMTTASGMPFDLRLPQPAWICIDDIAHHLALINRFTGATSRPYSVAEHSLLVAEIAERDLGMHGVGLLAALLHDAHEAYCNDVSTPAKREIGEGWHSFEQRLEHAVAVRFGIVAARTAYRDLIRQADVRALATERAQLLPPGGPAWSVLEGVQPCAWVNLNGAGRNTFTWHDWRAFFRDRFDELTFGRGMQMGELYPQPTQVSA